MDCRSRSRRDEALTPGVDRKWQEPDLVLVSSSTDAIILVELTVPWEDRLQYSNALKADKYADLSMDLEAKGYRTDLFPIEVGRQVDLRFPRQDWTV